MQYPCNQIDLERRFNSNEACLGYLVLLRWPNGFVCPSCQKSEFWKLSRHRFYCRNCKTETTATVGTVFEKSHLPLPLWFRAIWAVVSQKHGMSALGLQKALGLGSYRTAWMLLHKIRLSMVSPNRELLKGPLELDETMVGGRHAGRISRWKDKCIVLIAAEKDGKKVGRIRAQFIPGIHTEHILKALKNMVQPGVTLETDGCQSYRPLVKEGYQHKRTVTDVSLGEIELLPRVHLVASHLKRWLLGIHHGRISQKHLQAYLNEFVFRFNRRTSRSRGLLFQRVLENAVQIQHSTYKAIIKK